MEGPQEEKAMKATLILAVCCTPYGGPLSFLTSIYDLGFGCICLCRVQFSRSGMAAVAKEGLKKDAVEGTCNK